MKMNWKALGISGDGGLAIISHFEEEKDIAVLCLVILLLSCQGVLKIPPPSLSNTKKKKRRWASSIVSVRMSNIRLWTPMKIMKGICERRCPRRRWSSRGRSLLSWKVGQCGSLEWRQPQVIFNANLHTFLID
jgi:hypothetical protein